MTPLTGPQLRALHAEFRQLGYTRRTDRPERLAVAALALGLPRLGSFNDLSAGQAGYLLRLLRDSSSDCNGDDAADSAGPAVPTAARPGSGSYSLADLAALIVIALWITRHQRRASARDPVNQLDVEIFCGDG